MIDAWLLLSQVAAAAPAGLHQLLAALRFHRGRERRYKAIDHSGDKATLCLPALIMMSSIPGVRGGRNINIWKVPWKLMEEGSDLTWRGSWLIQMDLATLSRK